MGVKIRAGPENGKNQGDVFCGSENQRRVGRKERQAGEPSVWASQGVKRVVDGGRAPVSDAN